jgi:hypothetical protein
MHYLNMLPPHLALDQMIHSQSSKNMRCIMNRPQDNLYKDAESSSWDITSKTLCLAWWQGDWCKRCGWQNNNIAKWNLRFRIYDSESVLSLSMQVDVYSIDINNGNSKVWTCAQHGVWLIHWRDMNEKDDTCIWFSGIGTESSSKITNNGHYCAKRRM